MAPALVAAGAGALVVMVLAAHAAHATDLKINPPSVDEGEFGLEDNSIAVLDRGRSSATRQTHFGEFGYGVTDYWWTELEGHWESGSDGLKFRTVDFENAFRLIRQGNWWPETALFLEYDLATTARGADSATVAGLFRKDVGPSSTTLNIFFDHDVGANAEVGTRLRYVGISTWRIATDFAPGIEFFGEPGRFSGLGHVRSQDHRLGPVLTGAVDIAGAGEVDYALGYLLGLTPASPNGTLVWRLEYDFRF